MRWGDYCEGFIEVCFMLKLSTALMTSTNELYYENVFLPYIYLYIYRVAVFVNL